VSPLLIRSASVTARALLFDDPPSYVGGAIPEFCTLRLAKGEKPYRVAAHDGHLFQVKRNFPMLCLKQGS